jgi:hypothetical protein
MVTCTLAHGVPNLRLEEIEFLPYTVVSSFYIGAAYSISHYLKANIASEITRLTLLVSTIVVSSSHASAKTLVCETNLRASLSLSVRFARDPQANDSD